MAHGTRTSNLHALTRLLSPKDLELFIFYHTPLTSTSSQLARHRSRLIQPL